MNPQEKKLVDILTDLKLNHHVSSVKAEFEAEGATFDEVLLLKNLVDKAGLDLTIKIGGCEALKDIFDAKKIGIKSLVAPMIETPYALKKYVNTVKKVFSDEERKNINFFINIETITGYNNIDNILELPEAQYLEGIILGRMDMAYSMGLSREEVNSPQILNIASDLAQKAIKYNKKFIVGGGVCPKSLDFFKKLSLYKFETRKVIFDSEILKEQNATEAILKALEFEIIWLKNKKNEWKINSKEDEERILMLESWCKNFQADNFNKNRESCLL